MSEKEEYEETIKSISLRDKIALRNSWLKVGVIGSLTAIFVVKIWQINFASAFAGFDFSDLLSLFLAMFSIGIAILFYLKATETSNTFYNNTYLFTKEVSEILGRVEAGFGERLRHLDEGYTGLKIAVEKIPFDRVKVEREIEKEEQQLQRVERERNELISSLAERASLEEKEKEALFSRLAKQDHELVNARREIQLLKDELTRASHDEEERISGLSPAVRQFFHNVIMLIGPDSISEKSPGDLSRMIRSMLKRSSPELVTALLRQGLVDDKLGLTSAGLTYLLTSGPEPYETRTS